MVARECRCVYLEVLKESYRTERIVKSDMIGEVDQNNQKYCENVGEREREGCGCRESGSRTCFTRDLGFDSRLRRIYEIYIVVWSLLVTSVSARAVKKAAVPYSSLHSEGQHNIS